MQCIINRRAEFSASHRYWLSDLTPEENQKLFGACARFPGHGHNYELFVSMIGDLDEFGMVLNLSDVKHIIRQEVIEPLNFSYLNDAWPEFQDTLPTTEFIAKQIWEKLNPHLPLVKVQLFETSKLWAEYEGKDMTACLTVGTHFSAAHRLALNSLSFEENSKIYGKCARPHGHGHNYHLEVTVSGDIDSRTGMIVDLVALEKVIDEVVVEPFDHTFLNKDIPYFEKVVPTAENIAVRIMHLLAQPIQNLGAKLHKIKLIESPNNSCELMCDVLLAQSQAQDASAQIPVLK